MADEALKSLTNLLENVPGWITELEGILHASTERQKEILFESQPAGTLVRSSKKPSKSSSLLSKPSKCSERADDNDAWPDQAKDDEALLLSQLPHMTPSDALRLSQRKRKTTSALSDLTGPPKFRSKGMVVVYYDGDTQKQFETLVRAIGGNRNALRKGKMIAKVETLSRASSGSSSEGSGGGEDRAAALPNKLTYKTTRAVRATTNSTSKDGTTQAFDRLDALLEKVQALCEKAAHQILRDGDCALEMRTAKEHVVDLKAVAEGELPALQKRAEKTSERQKRERDKEKAEEVSAVPKYSTPGNVNAKLENPFSSPGSLAIDLEADDSDEDDDDEVDFEVGAMNLNKFGIRSTRAPAIIAR